MHRESRGGFLAIVLSCLFAAPAAAQCQLEWQSASGYPGTDAWAADCVSWDPDGPGPASEVLVVGGPFQNAGPIAVQGVATWDRVTGQWGTIGGGFFGNAQALVPTDTGELYCAVNGLGVFNDHRVLHWDGAAWTQLGGLFDQQLRDLVRLPNGDLVACGSFDNVGGVAASRIARWDGTAWQPFGTGVNGPMRCLMVTQAGDLVIGGTFSQVDGVAANCIARWDGSSWSAFGSGMTVVGIDGPYAIVEMPDGDIVAAGFFPNAGGSPVGNVARWDGSAWHAMGGGLNTSPLFTGSAFSAYVTANGGLVVGGIFSTAGGQPAYSIARWNGTQWSPIGTGFPDPSFSSNYGVNGITELPGGYLVACGSFEPYQGQLGENVAIYSSSIWRALSPGFNDAVLALHARPDGDLIVGGRFSSSGVASNHIARWDGDHWSALGAGCNDRVHAIDEMPNGDLIVGGNFTSAGGVSASRIARWNGATWQPLGSGLSNYPNAVVAMPNGDVICAGAFGAAGGQSASRVARWDGQSWHPLGAGLNNSPADAELLPNGDVVFVGNFTQADGMPANGVVRWDGTSFQSMGSLWVPRDIDVGPDGMVWAAAGFGCMRWDGTAWIQVGNTLGSVWTVTAMPDGGVVLGGDFSSVNGVSANGLARFDGTSWSAFGSGLNSRPQATEFVQRGELAIGGIFTTANGAASPYFARVTTPCPSTVAVHATGCLGPDALTMLDRAWLGGMLRSRMNGLSPATVAVAVTGFDTASLVLSSVLPQAGAGCSLFAQPDVLCTGFPSYGRVDFEVPVPNLAPLLGQTFYHQHVSFELDPAGGIALVQATDAVALTVGSF